MKLTHEQGAASEQAALDHLLAAGCTLLERNWHCPFGEIDLIMQSGDTVLFVEVRYRRSSRFGGAGSALRQTARYPRFA